MSIRWDPLMVRAVASELDALLGGARLRALRLDARTRDTAFLFRERTLLWRLHPEHAMPLVRGPIDPSEQDQRLKGRVRAVRAPGDDRMVIIDLDGGSGATSYEIVIELMGNRLNAIVTEGEARTIRHVLRRRDGRLPARVGSSYEPPLPTGRVGADGSLSLDGWLDILEEVPPPDRARELARKVAWVSAINAQSFLGGTDSGSRDALARGHRAWQHAVTGEQTEPVTLETDRGPQPYPFPLEGMHARPESSLLEAMEAVANESGSSPAVEATLAIGPELLEGLEHAIERARRRLGSLQSELDEREDPRTLRSIGDLVLARYSEIPRGASSVTLRAFSGEDVEVDLDPARAVHENAAAFYDRAARAERTAERLPALIDRAAGELERLRALLEEARAGAADVDAIRTALPERPERGRGQVGTSLAPYRTFRSSGGLEIRVGRGARHNDDLTFRHSAPDDVWMHARHTAGAHVVLRWTDEGAPPVRDLHEAGALAALHSKARTSGSVPVDWTRRKYVRKPRGSAPGSVLPERVSTIFVHPDERLIEKLSSEPPSD